MSSIENHWSQIYQQTSQENLGWYEELPTTILEPLEQIDFKSGAKVFIPGIGLSSIGRVMHEAGFCVEATDLSHSAVESFQYRYPELAKSIRQHDITQPLNKTSYYDLWIDRAVFHFLHEEEAIAGYLDNLNKALNLGGYALFAEFSASGAEKCAGLPVKRYSEAELTDLLAGSFRRVYSKEFVFTNPFGQAKPYLLCLFKKISA